MQREPGPMEEQMAYVWTLRSQARVGSYQHECSNGPWMVLAGEEMQLRRLLAPRITPPEEK